MPNALICNGLWHNGGIWDDTEDLSDLLTVWPGLRSKIMNGAHNLPAGPCSPSQVPYWAYNTTIVKSAGTGTGVPLNPPVENYVFTI